MSQSVTDKVAAAAITAHLNASVRPGTFDDGFVWEHDPACFYVWFHADDDHPAYEQRVIDQLDADHVPYKIIAHATIQWGKAEIKRADAIAYAARIATTTEQHT